MTAFTPKSFADKCLSCGHEYWAHWIHSEGLCPAETLSPEEGAQAASLAFDDMTPEAKAAYLEELARRAGACVGLKVKLGNPFKGLDPEAKTAYVKELVQRAETSTAGWRAIKADIPYQADALSACKEATQQRAAERGEADPVNHPEHYTSGSIECIDAIQAALTPEEFRGYCKGNALKYCWRELHKGGDESLQKAQWYLNRLTKGK